MEMLFVNWLLSLEEQKAKLIQNNAFYQQIENVHFHSISVWLINVENSETSTERQKDRKTDRETTRVFYHYEIVGDEKIKIKYRHKNQMLDKQKSRKQLFSAK